MNNIIVTIKSSDNSFEYDFECAVDEPASEVIKGIFETISSVNPTLSLSSLYHTIRIDKSGKIIGDSQTFEEAGIVNGDYLTITPRKYAGVL